MGAVAAHPATPLRPPGTDHPPDGIPPKAFGRFEAAEPDELWVSDGLHGPIVAGRRAVLFALLDDHSRYVVGYRWGHGEDTLGMQAALHDAVKTHGCPQRLYCDNGAAYASGQLAWSAAVLDIKLVHSRPGKPQGRGKIERWNRTVRDQFLVEIDHDGRACEVGSLTELNRLFTAWLHQQYHRCVHSETGATPIERYHADGPRPRRRGRTRRCCAGRSCGASSAGSPRSRPCRCTATATRSTPRWSGASSTCCSPRST